MVCVSVFVTHQEARRYPHSCAGGRSRPRRWMRRAAASGSAGMPVRWPRRPAAVSEAVAAGAGPDFSCAGELEEPLKALIGEVRSPSVVCVCVSGLVGKVCGRVVDLPPWSVSSRVVCACWGSGFRWDPKQDFLCLGAPLRVCLSSRYLRPVLECARGWCLRGVRFPRRALASAAAAARARATCNLPCLLCVRLWCYAPYRRRARSALCAVFGVCGCGAF